MHPARARYAIQIRFGSCVIDVPLGALFILYIAPLSPQPSSGLECSRLGGFGGQHYTQAPGARKVTRIHAVWTLHDGFWGCGAHKRLYCYVSMRLSTRACIFGHNINTLYIFGHIHSSYAALSLCKDGEWFCNSIDFERERESIFIEARKMNAGKYVGVDNHIHLNIVVNYHKLLSFYISRFMLRFNQCVQSHGKRAIGSQENPTLLWRKLRGRGRCVAVGEHKNSIYVYPKKNPRQYIDKICHMNRAAPRKTRNAPSALYKTRKRTTEFIFTIFP